MSLTVSELLALEGLSALRLRAGKQGLQRAVRWYYVAENEHIAEWIMGGELVFITGINHPRDEANLIQLLMEGKQRGIAGMVILTGEAYIHAIPATLIALADELDMPLIEQPYLLKMVIVTERIGTALVRSENVLQSQRDILMQLVTGDYPDLQMLHQRALHQQLDFTRPLRLAALRLEGLSRLFRQFPPEQAEAWLLQAHRSVRQQLQQQLNQQGNPFPLLERSNMFLFLLPDEEGEGFQQKKWLQQWLQTLADGEESLSLLCGLSAPVRQLQGYPRALSQARQALDLCDTLRPTQRISDYQQLGFIKLLSAVSDPALLNDFMHDTLGCLIEPGRKAPWLLLETLETLLQENGNGEYYNIGELSGKTVYEYDTNGLLAQTQVYDLLSRDRPETHFIYEYSDSNRVVEKYRIDDEGNKELESWCKREYYPNGKLKTVVRNSIVQEKYDEQGRPIDERPGFEILYKDFQDYGCDANGNWIETKNFKDYVDFGTGLGRILKPYIERIFTYYEE